MSRSTSSVLLAATLWLAGCPEPGVFRLGVNLNNLELELTSTDMGIFPDRSVLRERNNPFAKGTDQFTKFDIESWGVPVPRFYVWASALAKEPTGENQFYTAGALRDIYNLEQVDPDELYLVREMAIRAYQSVLDNFPDSVTFDASGRIPFALAPLAFDGIESLGGTPEGGWVRVATPDGGTTVVKVGP